MDDEPTFGAWLKRRRTQLDLNHEALLLNQDVTSEHEIGICLLGAAGVQESPRSGALLLGASWATLEAAGEIIQPMYQTELEPIEEVARAALGEEAFEAAFAKGGALPIEQAIAMALAESDDWLDGDITLCGWGLAEPTAADGTE